MANLARDLLWETKRFFFGSTWGDWISTGFLPPGKEISRDGKAALERVWHDMNHESARIVDADQAGKLDEYLATKERAR